MISISHLEVGTLATFLRLGLDKKQSWPIPYEKFRNGSLGQNWIQSAHRWTSATKVIDVGCGYSDLPLNIAALGSEVWGADDFGLNSGDIYWLRGKHPQEFVNEHPQVRYVFERLGAKNQFPDDYFDVVISNQALHVAKPPHAPIWQDMLRVLKKSPGSEILVSMICNFASDGNPGQAIRRLKQTQQIEHSVLDRMTRGESVSLEEFESLQSEAGQSFHRFSPALYVAYVAAALGAKPCPIPAALLSENFCTCVNSLTDPASVGFNNARFSNSPEEAKNFRYGRYAPVLMQLRWESDTDHVASPPDALAEWRFVGATNGSSRPSTFSVSPLLSPPSFTLLEDGATSTHMMVRELGLPGNQEIGISVLVRPAGRNFMGLWLRSSEGTEDLVEAFFDLLSSAVTWRKGHGNGELISANVTPVGNGWVRCTLRGIPTRGTASARAAVLVRKDSDGTSRYQGVELSGIEVGLPVVIL